MGRWVVALSGLGVNPVIAVPATLAFGDVAVSTSSTLQLTIKGTFTPTGGTGASKTATLRIKGLKKPPKHRAHH